MSSRKKKLEKGINSIEHQINIHKEKLRQAEENEKLELAGYYEKEIAGLEQAKENKKKLLDKN